MARKARQPSISKLEERKAEITAQIAALKREKRKEAARLERERFAVLGRALAKALQDDHELAAHLEPIIERYVTSPKDRKLLELDAAPAEPASGGGGRGER